MKLFKLRKSILKKQNKDLNLEKHLPGEMQYQLLTMHVF